ncbi:hypothetical protein BC829DRAFT_274057 [Chytridium lagenaria]|nr:hypothetical protein BC829DRAFT_274057 [Chytridium lagenaria]
MSNMTESVFSNHSSPLFDPDYVPTDMAGLQSYFRACLKTATSKKPIIIALMGIDKIQSSTDVLGMGWLPVEDLPPHVYLSVTVSSSNPEVWESLNSRIDLACSAMSEANLSLFTEIRLLADSFDIPTCQVALNRWLEANGRTLTTQQRRGLLTAAIVTTNPSSAQSAANQTGPTMSALPWNLKLHFSLGSSFRSWDQEAFPAGGTSKIIDYILGMLERAHGKTIIERFFRIACLMRDGISESEMEDLLSVDPLILADSVAAQLSQLRSTEPPIPRVSSIVLANVIMTL